MEICPKCHNIIKEYPCPFCSYLGYEYDDGIQYLDEKKKYLEQKRLAIVTTNSGGYHDRIHH